MLWGGRFTEKECSNDMKTFNSSINIDKRLFKEDLQGSRAYARSLNRVGLLTEVVHEKIQWGLQKIEDEWSQGEFVLCDDDEDIHTAHERRLKELVGGEVAGSLHAGRSRNDHVVTDVLLWMTSKCQNLISQLKNLMKIVVNKAKKDVHVIMPGYTHMQRAQPIRWSHLLLSYAFMFERDLTRLCNLLTSIDACPLGSGALAGNPFNIDRELLASDLKFKRLTNNSIDTVGNRDFIADFLHWASMFSMHCSRISEDLIIFSTKEFNYITLSEKYSTGSSLMPQKKNPDSLELIRGKCGKILGRDFGMLATMKSLPSAYNKDMQDDKEVLFEVHDDVCEVITIIGGVFDTLIVYQENCTKSLSPDILATDLAYYLTKKGVPFREAHTIVGMCVVRGEQLQCNISEIPLEELKTISSHFSENVTDVWDFEKSVEQYQSIGGTSLSSVWEQIKYLETLLDN